MTLQLRTMLVLAALASLCGLSRADTFTDEKTGDILHGYIAGRTEDGRLKLTTAEKGPIEAAPSKYSIVRDAQGRTDKVVVLSITGTIEYECVTKAFAKALQDASSKGPQFILIEMDTPGGRLDLAKELCTAIDDLDTDVVIFIKGGKYGGAISAGAAVALACNKVYIARNAVFGGATVVASTGRGITDIKKAVGDDVGEKISSIWRGTMASMAEKRDRSGVIAKAMVDRQITVCEVTRDGKRTFVEQTDLRSAEPIVKRWNGKGKLITLTGEEAVKCGMADGLADSRQDVLKAMNAPDALLVEDKSVQAAADQFELAKTRSDLLIRSLNSKFGRLRATTTRPAGMKLIREIKTDMGNLVAIGKANPDLNLDIKDLEKEYAQVEAFYKQAVRD